MKRKVLFVSIVLFATLLLLCSCGSSDSSTSSTEKDEANEETVYTYRYNEWNLYVATMLSDSVVKVEKWSRVVADDDEYPFEYECDLSTVTIDEENKGGFYWIDKNQTAFCINLKDPDLDYLEEDPSIPFVKTTDKTISSANYSDSIYIFNSDKWNMYVASKLTDSIVKIEKWYTAVASDEYPHEYKSDVCVINTDESSASDFAWVDDKETAFTVSLSDINNDDLENGSKQSFTINTEFKEKYHLSSLELPATDYSEGSYTRPETAHKSISELDIKDTSDEDTSDEGKENTDEEQTDSNDSSSDSSKALSDSSAGLSEDFKSTMDSYEKFFDKYVAFMKKYNSSNDTASMLSDYNDMMKQYAETMEKLEAIDEDELNDEELAYYNEVMGRINNKLATIY